MNNKTFWEAMQELSPALFKTYVAIHKLADNEVGYCFATNEYISEKINKHEKSVSRDIADLIEKGYLYSNVIKKGFAIIERRLYTVENLKTYLSDKENIKLLIKTTTKEVEGIIYFFNENKNNTSNRCVTGNNTGNKFVTCTSNKNVTCTGNKNEELTNTNITNLNITTTNTSIASIVKEKTSSSSFLKKYLDLATEQNLLVIKPNITEKEFLEVWKRCELEVEQGFAKNKNAVLIQALKGQWNFRSVDNKISEERKKISNLEELKKLQKLQDEKEKYLSSRAELEKLKELYDSLSPEEQKEIDKIALEKAKSLYSNNIAGVMARTQTRYDILKDIYCL